MNVSSSAPIRPSTDSSLPPAALQNIVLQTVVGGASVVLVDVAVALVGVAAALVGVAAVVCGRLQREVLQQDSLLTVIPLKADTSVSTDRSHALRLMQPDASPTRLEDCSTCTLKHSVSSALQVTVEHWFVNGLQL